MVARRPRLLRGGIDAVFQRRLDAGSIIDQTGDRLAEGRDMRPYGLDMLGNILVGACDVIFSIGKGESARELAEARSGFNRLRKRNVPLGRAGWTELAGLSPAGVVPRSTRSRLLIGGYQRRRAWLRWVPRAHLRAERLAARSIGRSA